MTNPTPTIDVRRADDRAKTRIGWLDSKHSFSMGQHWDPNNTHHGVLLVNNDDTVTAGGGFDMHPHRDMEIVTWVIQGSLVHQDSEGNTGVIYPGLAQRMSAGTGILHSEKNDSWRVGVGEAHDEPVRFVQMWVQPDARGIRPGYQQEELPDSRLRGKLAVVASGMDAYVDTTAISIANQDAALHAARLAPGDRVVVPDAPYVHIFVTRGNVALEGAGTLRQGDAVRLTGVGGQTLTGVDDAEVLVWEMHAIAA